MKRELICVLEFSLLVGLVLSGCRQKSAAVSNTTGRQETAQPGATSISSTAELRRLFSETTHAKQISTRLGEPQWKDAQDGNAEAWYYKVTPFPADDGMRNLSVIGFSVTFTNERLAYWSCRYASSPELPPSSRQVMLGGDAAKGATRKLEFFAVSSEPIRGGRYIDTPILPRLGFIGATPDLVIEKVKEITLNETPVVSREPSSPTNWVAVIVLEQEDAVRFRSLTVSNLSKTLLIMVEGEPIAAPRVVLPVENGVVGIQLPDRKAVESLRKKLSTMGAKRTGGL